MLTLTYSETLLRKQHPFQNEIHIPFITRSSFIGSLRGAGRELTPCDKTRAKLPEHFISCDNQQLQRSIAHQC